MQTFICLFYVYVLNWIYSLLEFFFLIKCYKPCCVWNFRKNALSCCCFITCGVKCVYRKAFAGSAICYVKAWGFWGFGNQIWKLGIERTRMPLGESVVVVAWLLFVTMIEAAFQDIHVLRAIAAINHSGNFISGCHFTLSNLLNLSTVEFLHGRSFKSKRKNLARFLTQFFI